jgi:hypothetical protein
MQKLENPPESDKAHFGPFHSGSTAKRLAGKHIESFNANKWNAKHAGAIDFISEASPEAKPSIRMQIFIPPSPAIHQVFLRHTSHR